MVSFWRGTWDDRPRRARPPRCRGDCGEARWCSLTNAATASTEASAPRKDAEVRRRQRGGGRKCCTERPLYPPPRSGSKWARTASNEGASSRLQVAHVARNSEAATFATSTVPVACAHGSVTTAQGFARASCSSSHIAGSPLLLIPHPIASFRLLLTCGTALRTFSCGSSFQRPCACAPVAYTTRPSFSTPSCPPRALFPPASHTHRPR